MSRTKQRYLSSKRTQFEALQESSIDVNEEGHLTIEGQDAVHLAKEFGTPLWVVSESTLRNNFRTFLGAFKQRYPSFSVAYGAKANHAPAILQIMLQEGARIDFVSMTQLYLAKMAGANPNRLVFNGNNKSLEELESAVQDGVGFINVDSIDELRMLDQVCERLRKRARVNIRVRGAYSDLRKTDPAFVASNTRDDKFGIDIPSGQALETCAMASKMQNVELVGLHHHVGWSAYGIPYNRRMDLARVRSEARDVLDFLLDVEAKVGIRFSVLDLGGGFRKPRPHPFGPRKTMSIPRIDEYAETITSVIKSKLRSSRSSLPELILEPGGYMVTDAVTLLSTVGNTKEVKEGPGRGKWVAVDSSAYMFARKLIFKFYHHTVIANKVNSAAIETVDIVGNTCAPDYIADKVRVPHLEQGDLVATLDQGSYCETVSTQYCGIPRPAAILVNKRNASLIKRRETPENILSLYSIPAWLSGSRS
jgi:diaminopimelate decarboxylase